MRPLRTYGLHAFLFVATCATTYLAQGAVFAASLMAILVTHELGHYVTARRHKIDVSLPYFIPVPFAIGTMGAIIRMRAPIERRDALVDIGASGPLAGLAVAIPLLVIGLIGSPVGPTTPASAAEGGSFIEGNSLLYILLKLVIKGRYLPGGGVDVELGPMAMAAWVGLLITFINLIPIGQLDGGHVACGLAPAGYERRARLLHGGLALVAALVTGALAREAHAAGRDWRAALAYGGQSGLPWLVWATLLIVMYRLAGRRYHPPVSEEPLSRSRRILGGVVAVIFVLIFTPVPMREAL